MGKMKLNFDGSYVPDLDKAGFGSGIKNSSAEEIFCYSGLMGA